MFLSYKWRREGATFDDMELTAWLSSDREYWSGVKLLKKHSSNAFLIRMLSSGEDTYNAEKLIELIADLAEDEKAAAKALPEDVAAMSGRAGQAMDERAALKAQLRVLPGPDERKKAAFEILRLNQELNELFRQLDFYERFGHLPKPDALPDDPVELLKKRGNIRTYISRARRAGDSAKLQSLQEELDMIERKLKGYE